jgi:hypothetical protein
MKPLFDNPSIGKFTTSDLDVWMEYFLRSQEDIPEDEKPGITIGYIREQIIKLEARLNQPIYAEYRRSSSGHIHIRVTFPEEISAFDNFLLRTVLVDDLTRHHLDEKRYALWGSLNEINKCFDSKGEAGGKPRHSGPWIPLSVGLNELTGEPLADWKQYWNSIGQTPHKGSNHENLIRQHWKELTGEQRSVLLKELAEGLKAENEQRELGFV